MALAALTDKSEQGRVCKSALGFMNSHHVIKMWEEHGSSAVCIAEALLRWLKSLVHNPSALKMIEAKVSAAVTLVWQECVLPSKAVRDIGNSARA